MKFLGSDGSAFVENAEWQISDDLRKFFSFLKTSLQNQIFSKFPQNLQTFFLKKKSLKSLKKNV